MWSTFTLFDKRYSDAKAIVDAINETIACPSVAYTKYLSKSSAIGAAVLAAGIMSGGIGGVLLIPLVPWFKKHGQSIANKLRIKRKKKEKEVLLKEIIAKQQAIINKLEKQNEYNQQEIINLKEALEALKEVQSAVDVDFGLA